MSRFLAISALAVASAASGAGAFIVDCRWTYFDTVQSAFQPVPLTGLNIDPSSQSSVRLQLGFRVTDGNPSDAAGGFIGWNFGTLVASGDCCDFMTRTPGRRSPFTFLPNGNGLPTPDPVACDQMLTAIDATLGSQTLLWGCAPDGTPLPMPAPVVRGLGSFVSIYEVTLHLRPGLGSATVTAGGNAVVASAWGMFGPPIPPDCGDPQDPSDDFPGSVTYLPATPPPVSFSCVATVNCIPAPGSAAFLVLASLMTSRRRRN